MKIQLNLNKSVFTGEIEANNISRYKYVAYKDNVIVEEESITRTYSEENSSINEVYNRYKVL